MSIVTDKIIHSSNADGANLLQIKVNEAGTTNSNVDINLNLKSDMPNDVIVTIRLLKENNGKYNEMGNTVQHKVCEFIKNDKLFYASLRKCGNMPGRCPFRKETNYYVKHYKVLANEMPPLMPLGKWKIEFLIKNDTTNLLSGEWYGRIIQ